MTPADDPAPEEQVALADSVGLALLVVLDPLTPSERLAFVLHDMFAVPFQEIGQILGESAAATKMVASRARRKVQATDRPPGPGREHLDPAARAGLSRCHRGWPGRAPGRGAKPRTVTVSPGAGRRPAGRTRCATARL